MRCVRLRVCRVEYVEQQRTQRCGFAWQGRVNGAAVVNREGSRWTRQVSRRIDIEFVNGGRLEMSHPSTVVIVEVVERPLVAFGQCGHRAIVQARVFQKHSDG